MELYIVIAIIVIVFLFFMLNYNNDKKYKNKGMYILVDENGYPNLYIYIIYNGLITVGIFDKNFTYYIGHPTMQKLNYELSQPTMFDLTKINKTTFINKFKNSLEKENKNPFDTYFKYKLFAMNQLYSGKMDITEKEFIDMFDQDLSQLNINSKVAYQQLKNINHI